MQGYWKNKKETDRVITVDDNGVRWLHTGDLGSVDADGFIYYSGRIKRIYPTAGIDGTTINKIFPQRIEECIESDDSVERCGVIVVPDAVRVNAPVACVLLKTGAARMNSSWMQSGNGSERNSLTICGRKQSIFLNPCP